MPEDVEQGDCISCWVFVLFLPKDIGNERKVVARRHEVPDNLDHFPNTSTTIRDFFCIEPNSNEWLEQIFSVFGDLVLSNKQCVFELVKGFGFGLAAILEFGDVVDALSKKRGTSLTRESRLREIR